MKRAITLGLLMLIGALSLALNAAQQPAGTQPMVVEVEKLKDNLFVLRQSPPRSGRTCRWASVLDDGSAHDLQRVPWALR